MKVIALLLGVVLLICCTGCAASLETADIAATTLPAYQFTSLLCEGTGLTVQRVITENVSCLHDYSLSVSQVRTIEAASLVVTSGAGLEEFMADLLFGKTVIDASAGIPLLESCHDHEQAHDGHHHDTDPHIWLDPQNAAVMAENIALGLIKAHPHHEERIQKNLVELQTKLRELLDYGKKQLSELRCRELITFHDGFAYFAQAFDLTILAAVEEESGSEASARELIELIELVRKHQLPAVFTEENGSVSAAAIISAETGARQFTLSMGMSGEDYFAAMYQNINTVKEALG